MGSEAIPSCPDPLVPIDVLRPPAKKELPFPSSNFICFTGRLVVPEKPWSIVLLPSTPRGTGEDLSTSLPTIWGVLYAVEGPGCYEEQVRNKMTENEKKGKEKKTSEPRGASSKDFQDITRSY